MLKAFGQTKSSAHTGAIAWVRPRGRQLGGTFFGLIVGLQSNGKMSQEEAYTEIRKVWKDLKDSKGALLSDRDGDSD